MTLVLPQPNAPAERNPDDFKRRADGTPYVSDPTGATVKSGDRAGEPKWVLYGRPSGFGQQIENTFNLRKWTERRIVLGIGNDPRLSEGVRNFYAADPDDDATKDELDAFVKRALDAAKAGLAAEQGTHSHELTEDAEQGDDEASWIARAERGERLGLPVEVQAAMVDAWRQMLDHYGFEVLASECKVVNDLYRQAGSLDRIVRLTRPLTIGGITLPAGIVLVLDTKTGKLKLRKDGGVSGYWNSYAVQIAVYAGSVPYDTHTETRGAWEYGISQKWALIAHLPVDEALAGKAVCRLVLVDIERGRAAADLCLAAKAWEDEQVFALGGTDVVVPVAKDPVQAVLDATQHRRPTAQQARVLAGKAPGVVASSAPKAPKPDEGEPADPQAVEALQARFKAMPDNAKLAMKRIAEEAQAADRPISVAQNPSVRRFEIARLLIGWATYANLEPSDVFTEMDGGAERHRQAEDLLRDVLTLVLGTDAASQPGVPVGAAVSLLDPGTARRCTEIFDRLAAGAALSVDEAGRPVLLAA